MRIRPLIEDRWTLVAPDDADIKALMAWFSDAETVNMWSGPRFRYPFTDASFRDDCRIDDVQSYCLKNPDGVLVAFGQLYDRYDRAHLARLVTHPDFRRQGIGRRLIRMLINAAQQISDYSEYSLFVYRDNEAAYRCYLAMGFVLQDYPDDAPMKDKCFFLTRHRPQASAQPL